jgi:hypothetical protein
MLKSRLAGLLLLIGLATVWVSLLWFVLPVDLTAHSPIRLGLWHLLPPLGAWLGISLFLHRRKRKRREAAEAYEVREQIRRQQAREEARHQYEAAMRQRQFGCHCRGLWVQADAEADLAEVFPNAEITHAKPDGASGSYIQPLIALYKQCPGALALPLYLVPPADAIAIDVMEHVKRGIQPVVEALYWEQRHKPRILFAPRANHAADSALAIFEQNADLPGAVVLAFDSPLARIEQAQEQAATAEHDAVAENTASLEEQLPGGPAGGALAFLFTHPALDDMLSTASHAVLLADAGNRDDAMKPYWEKRDIPEGHLAMLAVLTRQERSQLQALPVWAGIHRSHSLMTEKGWRPLQRVQHLQSALEQALISAGLLAFPFTYADGEASQEKAEKKDGPVPEASTLAVNWLVHNAGGPEAAAGRMTDIGGALNHFKLDLNPVSEATNTIMELGNWGKATPWALLASSIAKAGELQAPVLSVQYFGDREAAIAVVMKAASAITNEGPAQE